LHRIIGATGYCITTVGCAKVPIVAIQRRTCLAIECCITGFGTVADIPVIAGSIIRHIYTGIAGYVAGITTNPIIATWGCAGHTGTGDTGFRTVAEHAIITVSVNCALGNCAVRITLVVDEISVVVEAEIITTGIFARRRLTRTGIHDRRNGGSVIWGSIILRQRCPIGMTIGAG
jgi:hypothetical protein